MLANLNTVPGYIKGMHSGELVLARKDWRIFIRAVDEPSISRRSCVTTCPSGNSWSKHLVGKVNKKFGQEFLFFRILISKP